MHNRELLDQSLAFLSGKTTVNKSNIGLLRDLVREHNRLYYIESAAVIDDGEWDRLFKLLERSERDLQDFDALSPTQRIDVLTSRQFEKAKHLTPMISLDNTYDASEIRDFADRARRILGGNQPLPSCLELKFDGLGLSLLYRAGRLTRALTRGNGVEGEDVTLNALEIESIPKFIQFEQEIEIRGEIVMPHSAFERVNQDRLKNGEKLFANPRNAASGSLRQLDATITRSRGLEFFAYSVPYLEGDDAFGIHHYRDSISKLDSWGFQVSPFFEFYETAEQLASRVEELALNRPKFGFDIDGLVLKFDELSLWRELGATEHHPRSAIAYKFPQENVRTRITFVEHSVGRTGQITPVAHLEPVNVTGVMVRRATLHNYEETERKDIRVGDSVFIVRAGEVIPEVVASISEVRDGTEVAIMPPLHCPSCGTLVVKDEGKVAHYCPNSLLCPAQTSGSLKAFVSKHAANIDGLGDKFIDLFREKGLLTDFVSIYKLPKHRDAILELEGFELKKTDNILDAIEGSRNMELARLLLALCIPEIGRKTAKILALHVAEKMAQQSDFISVNDTIKGSGQAILNTLLLLTPEELIEIRDIGPVASEEIVDYITDNREMLEKLFDEVSPILPAVAPKGGTLSGMSFCVTGSFVELSRDQIHELVEANGGEVRTSVSPKLTYLIVGAEAGSKLEKARELGVKVLSLDEFLLMID